MTGHIVFCLHTMISRNLIIDNPLTTMYLTYTLEFYFFKFHCLIPYFFKENKYTALKVEINLILNSTTSKLWLEGEFWNHDPIVVFLKQSWSLKLYKMPKGYYWQSKRTTKQLSASVNNM